MQSYSRTIYGACVFFTLVAPLCAPTFAQTNTVNVAKAASPSIHKIDHDLMEASITQLQQYYASGTYTVTQVVQWYLQRIRTYNGIYKAVESVDEAGALKLAAQYDAFAKSDVAKIKQRPALWGIPILIKANTSIAGHNTTAGWKGYKLPGHELIAPKDATVVAKLKAVGAIILGTTNMPDFAASNTNRSSSFGRTGNAYDVRFSPGGSSGGTVTGITGNFAVFGTGTDTGNSIRMPAATSAVVGVFPTRGLVSIAGIAPMDWQLDNTGPITRTVRDAAIALDAMRGEDPLDNRTHGTKSKAHSGSYTDYLKRDALKGKRFGVPAFIMNGAGIPFQGVPAAVPNKGFVAMRQAAVLPLQAETRAAFMKALDGLRAAGATIVIDDKLLPDRFAEIASRIATQPYIRQGTDAFLKNYGSPEFSSSVEYEKRFGTPLPASVLTGYVDDNNKDKPTTQQRQLETDPEAEANLYTPRRLALAAYEAAFKEWQLDGLVYPATQMPPPDETMPQDGQLSSGPHSLTGWGNMLGNPAVVVPGGFYPNGLPFGLEFAGLPWKDGDLLGFAYAYEQITQHRKPPVMVEKGLLKAGY